MAILFTSNPTACKRESFNSIFMLMVVMASAAIMEKAIIMSPRMEN